MDNENKFEKLEPIRVKALDDILGIPFKILDDGFVRVIDYLGSDQSIVQAARVSYGKGTKQVSQDRGLIRYLLRHRHTTPFEMCEIKLHIRIPMDAWRQWIRHRTANVNEYSTRYSLAIESAQTTYPDQWRMQSTDNKQGSSGFFDAKIGNEMTADEKYLHEKTREIYNKRVAQGVAREQARKDLPLSTYTEAYWKIDLHNLLHFLELRMEKNAQLEIREYANTIGNEIVKRWAPIAWEAFEEYALNSKEFSGFELELLSLLANSKLDEAKQRAIEYGWLKYKNDELTFNMERWEFENKMNDLKIRIPW
ncbi:MAG: thymidylate synthase (FAD) [Ignavibacteriales bacterium CG18_big_fil_WC_8_21_14_2_50_31_20]|nr:MAG: thymidylate synthase (FAD) [Ignavibacteriales bacterium CG18_big_fil_WC_8_21_14_2_50_31_20]